jgi:hypothetical protein
MMQNIIFFIRNSFILALYLKIIIPFRIKYYIVLVIYLYCQYIGIFYGC